MTIYKIVPNVDDYQSLLAADEALAGSGLLAFNGRSKKGDWPNPLLAMLDNVEAPEPDVLDLGAGNLVFHGRSQELMRAKLHDYCELLPVKWAGHEGEVVNVVSLSDCLDSERTKWVIGRESGKRIRVEKFEFIRAKIPNRLIFKIPERPFELFCTDQFKNLLESHKIIGVDLEPVWQCDAPEMNQPANQ